MPGAIRLSVNKNIHPHIDTPRKTPIVLKDYIKQELDNMVKNKIIRKETKADPVLDQLQGIITARWPDSIKDLPLVIQSYWPYRDEQSVNDGIIMKDSRIIFPETQQKISWTCYITAIKVLKKHVFKPEMLYTGSKLMQISRTWSRIVQYARKTFRHNQRKLYSHMTSPAEHGKLLAHNHEYLIIADYYSKFPLIRKMNGLTTSNMVILTMKQVFSEHGIPSRVVSDNGHSTPVKQSKNLPNTGNLTTSHHHQSSQNQRKSNTLWDGTSSYLLAPATAFLQQQTPAATSSRPANTFLHQQISVLNQRPPIQRIPVLYQLSSD